MSPFRPDRSRRGPDPLLGQKMLLLVTGAVLGIAGMATNRAWLVYTAAAVLSIGVLLRFFTRPRDEGDSDDFAGDDDAGGGPGHDADDYTRDDAGDHARDNPPRDT